MPKSKSLFAWLKGKVEAASEENTRDAAEDLTEQEAETGTDTETDEPSDPESETESEGTEATPEAEPEEDAADDGDDTAGTDAPEPEPQPDADGDNAGFRMSQPEVKRLGDLFGDATAAAECLAAGMTYEQAVDGLIRAQSAKLAAVETDLADRDERLAQIAGGSREEAVSGGTEQGAANTPRPDGLSDNIAKFADGMRLKK